MKARARSALTTLVLLAIAAGAVAVAWFGVHLRGAEEKAEEGRSKRVMAIDPARVRELRLVSGADAARLVREGETWRLVEPVAADADPDAVKRLLDRLSSLERRATSARAGALPSDLRPYGLDAPRARIEATLDDGKVETLALGEDTGFDGAMFVQPTSGEIVVVVGEARGDLVPGLEDLRDKRVLRFDGASAAALRIEGEGGPIEVRKEGEDAWKLVAPKEGKVEGWKVTSALSTLASLDAAAIAGEGPKVAAAAGLDPPRRTYVVLDAAGKELGRVLLGNEKGDRVLAKPGGSPRVFEVEGWRVKGLPKGAADLEPAAAATPPQRG